jgi:hypothetical protein
MTTSCPVCLGAGVVTVGTRVDFGRCLYCQRRFLVTRSDRVYCNSSCRAMAWHERKTRAPRGKRG